MQLNRRSNVVRGYVNFPVDSKEYISTGEGGLFVELWVVPKKDTDWMVCCGGFGINVTYCESLIGTDKSHNTDNFDEMMQEIKSGNKDARQRFYLEEELFPYMHKDEEQRDYNSIDLYACVNLGSTGWSGYHDDKGMWRCTFDDLNDDGKALYKSLEKLYGDTAELLLVTWLDT
jgi:hypothetical protein